MLKNTIITPDPSQVLRLCQSLAMRASEIALEKFQERWYSTIVSLCGSAFASIHAIEGGSDHVAIGLIQQIQQQLQ
jgi:hypothetical protein